MRKHILMTSLAVAFCVLLLAAVFANLGFAQEPERTAIRSVQVKPGMNAEFEEFLKNDLIPALKKGGVKDFGVWTTAVFGENGSYLLTEPIANIADFDNPSPVIKAVGEDGLAAMMAKLQKLVASSRTFIIADMPELAFPSPAGYVPKLGFEISMIIAPGRGEDYIKNAKALMEVLRKTNVKGAYTLSVGLGGIANERIIVVLLDSFADMAKFGQAFGKAAEEAKLAPMTGIVTNIEYTMRRYIPELSMSAPDQ